MLQQFYRFKSVERWLVVQSVILIPLTALGIRLFGFNRWYAWLNYLIPSTRSADLPQDSETKIIIRRTLRMVELASRRGLYSGNCLSRSLPLWWLLRRQGLNPSVRIGVRHNKGEFQAHAWVEYQGAPVNDNQQVYEEYTVFERPIFPRIFEKLS